MSETPDRWLDRLVGGCVGVLLGAMALYGAVQIVESVWVPLSIGVAAIAVISSAAWLLIARSRRW